MVAQLNKIINIYLVTGVEVVMGNCLQCLNCEIVKKMELNFSMVGAPL